MAMIKVHAGDFSDGSISYFDATFHVDIGESPLWGGGETISTSELEVLEKANEENVKRIGGTIGWGAAGAILLGPVGLLAGLLLGGKKTEVTFVARFRDGRRLLATTDGKTFAKMQAAIF